ncbi:DnaD domain-containing protein [Solibacillus sp. FSL H8-0538]|uniref:DnaD domain-containing protein n=1 Tax=Solibacillus sp. FSL H8-0538 TaxID=2921400 RepID=UPI0030F7A18A
MNTAYNRIRVWTEQGNVTIPQLFFQFYRQLNVADDEAIIVLHLLAFHAEGVEFPTPDDLVNRTHFQPNAISLMLQRLMQKGLLEITQGVDAAGKLNEKFSLYPLWERILDHIEASQQKVAQIGEKNEEAAIFGLFEQEFGRLLSPIEIETIGMWIDVDRHSVEIIKAALKEAVLAGKVSLRYIDRILFEWKKKNITSIKQIEQHTEQFRQRSTVTHQPQQPPVQDIATKKVSFYNWLEERE